jgi:type I restriction enzyme S subunit
VVLGEVLEPAARFECPQAGVQYRQLGVRLWGEGAYEREPIDGAATQYSTLNRCETGDLVVNKIWARNGSVSVVQHELSGCVVSSEFPLYRVKPATIPGWLRLITKARWFWTACDEKARGTSGKNRIKPSAFLEIVVPLPPLADQERLVASLYAIESRLTNAKKLRDEALVESQAFTISLHHHLSKDRVRRLDQLLQIDEEQEPIKADGAYPQVGIRSFGEGMFRKSPTLGSETTYRSFNVLRAGKLVMSQVKGWEGAVAVCPEDLDGWFVSPEYRTFACREGECDPIYLAHLVKTTWFHQRLVSATRGVGARRERIRPEMLLGIEIPFPDLAGQKAALKSIEHLTRAQSLTKELSSHAEALIPSLIDGIFTHATA